MEFWLSCFLSFLFSSFLYLKILVSYKNVKNREMYNKFTSFDSGQCRSQISAVIVIRITRLFTLQDASNFTWVSSQRAELITQPEHYSFNNNLFIAACVAFIEPREELLGIFTLWCECVWNFHVAELLQATEVSLANGKIQDVIIRTWCTGSYCNALPPERSDYVYLTMTNAKGESRRLCSKLRKFQSFSSPSYPLRRCLTYVHHEVYDKFSCPLSSERSFPSGPDIKKNRSTAFP